MFIHIQACSVMARWKILACLALKQESGNVSNLMKMLISLSRKTQDMMSIKTHSRDGSLSCPHIKVFLFINIFSLRQASAKMLKNIKDICLHQFLQFMEGFTLMSGILDG